MERKKKFKSTKEVLDFLRSSRKRFEASSKKADAKFEKERRGWEERDKAYDLDLEKKKHEDFMKRMKKVMREQKVLVEKVERMRGRQTDKRTSAKAKKYGSVFNETGALVAEPFVKYKAKKKTLR